MSMNRPEVIFENRQDAGRHLALRLMEYAGQPVVVLAIPNGGVPVALEVASALKVELDLIVCRKIPIPLTPEAGAECRGHAEEPPLHAEAVLLKIGRQQLGSLELLAPQLRVLVEPVAYLE